MNDEISVIYICVEAWFSVIVLFLNWMWFRSDVVSFVQGNEEKKTHWSNIEDCTCTQLNVATNKRFQIILSITTTRILAYTHNLVGCYYWPTNSRLYLSFLLFFFLWWCVSLIFSRIYFILRFDRWLFIGRHISTQLQTNKLNRMNNRKIKYTRNKKKTTNSKNKKKTQQTGKNFERVDAANVRLRLCLNSVPGRCFNLIFFILKRRS